MMRRTLVAAVFVLVGAFNAQAQEATTLLIDVPQAQRNAGVYTTPSTTFDPTVRELLIRLRMPTADYEDPLNSVMVRLYFLDTTTQTWRQSHGARWNGGRFIDPETGEVNPTPVMSPGITNLLGREVRAEFEIVRRMRIGCTIETLP